MRKKMMAVVLSCLTFFTFVISSVGFSLHASAVSMDEMTKTAVEIITRSEGTYGSINRNDNGAVSIGILQWHATRALQLMRSIANADSATAKSILGSSFYNEVMSASNWNSRTFSVAEGSAASSLLTTSTGKAKQDALAYSDVEGYINAGKKYGITDAGVLVYYAEIYNRGSGVAARILNAAKGSGSYTAITLEKLHNAALTDSGNSSGYYTSRLNNAYNTIIAKGWAGAAVSGDSSSNTNVDTSDFSDKYAGTYTVTATSLNIRSAPSTSASKIGSIPNGASITVSSGNGSWAAVSYGNINGYCSMDYLKLVSAATTPSTSTDNFSEAYAGSYKVNATSLYVRSAPSTSASKLGTLANNTIITVIASDGSWAKISFNGKTGYCSMDYLVKSEAVTTTTTTTTAKATTTNTAPMTTTALQSTTQPVASTVQSEVPTVGVSNPNNASIYGDVNCDGVVDACDAVLLQKYLNGSVYLSYTQLSNADCQRDNVLNTTDVTVIMQYLIDNLIALPIV